MNVLPSLGLACRIKDFDYVTTLVFITLGPLVFAAFLFLLYGLEFLLKKHKAIKLDDRLKNNVHYAVPKDLVHQFSKTEVTTIRRTFAFFDKFSRGRVDRTLFSKSEATPDLSFGDYMYLIQQSCQVDNCETGFAELNDAAEAKANPHQEDSMFFFLLLFSFVVLIGTSSTVFEYFQCTHFEEVEPAVSYLARDYSLDCSSPRYKEYVAYAVVMLFIYPIG
jgi:hypothetical protein